MAINRYLAASISVAAATGAGIFFLTGGIMTTLGLTILSGGLITIGALEFLRLKSIEQAAPIPQPPVNPVPNPEPNPEPNPNPNLNPRPNPNPNPRPNPNPNPRPNPNPYPNFNPEDWIDIVDGPRPQNSSNAQPSFSSGQAFYESLIAEIMTRNNLQGIEDAQGYTFTDAQANEITAYIQTEFTQLGEEGFLARYNGYDVDRFYNTHILPILPESNAQYPNDNALCAMGRKLGLSEACLLQMQNNREAVEDELAVDRQTINQHTNGFHARFSLLSPAQREKLIIVAQIKEQQEIQAHPDNITQTANQMFRWIANLCRDFTNVIADLDNTYTQALESLGMPAVEPNVQPPAEEPQDVPVPQAVEVDPAQPQPDNSEQNQPSSVPQPEPAPSQEQQAPSALPSDAEQRRQMILAALQRRNISPSHQDSSPAAPNAEQEINSDGQSQRQEEVAPDPQPIQSEQQPSANASSQVEEEQQEVSEQQSQNHPAPAQPDAEQELSIRERRLLYYERMNAQRAQQQANASAQQEEPVAQDHQSDQRSGPVTRSQSRRNNQ